MHTVPNGVPQSLSAEAIYSNSTIISWTEVECIERNGPITHYVIQYGTSCDEFQTENTRDNSTLSYTIKGLTPHTEYIIQVAAANVHGRGPFTEPAIKVSTAAEGNIMALGRYPCMHYTYLGNIPGGLLES